jgi:hypothetical protein
MNLNFLRSTIYSDIQILKPLKLLIFLLLTGNYPLSVLATCCHKLENQLELYFMINNAFTKVERYMLLQTKVII